MACTAASYGERDEAVHAKQRVTKTYKMPAAIRFCEDCERYHVDARPGEHLINEKRRKILYYLAQGYRQPDIGPLVGGHLGGVEDAIREMRERFYALNNVNLVAIVISLGIINPNDFVPKIEERSQA
jgi:hypothetical protein